MHVIALGNAFDGIKLVGPFETPEDATDWAENSGDDWQLIYVDPVRPHSEMLIK